MPASSNVVEFTITFASAERGSCGKTCRRACWLNLEAHPAQDESGVSFRTCSRDIGVHLLPSIADCRLRIVEPGRVLNFRFAMIHAQRKRPTSNVQRPTSNCLN